MIRKKMVYYRPCIPLPSLAAGIRTYNGRLKAAVPRRGFHTHHSNVFHIFGILQGEISILMLKRSWQNDSFCSSSPFYYPIFPADVRLPQFRSSDFTAYGFGKRFTEFHNTRIFIRRGVNLDVLLDILFQRFGRFRVLYQDDGSFDHLSAYGVWSGGDGAFQNVRQLHDHAFDFKRPDSVA